MGIWSEVIPWIGKGAKKGPELREDRARLFLEALEDRILPSSDPFQATLLAGKSQPSNQLVSNKAIPSTNLSDAATSTGILASDSWFKANKQTHDNVTSALDKVFATSESLAGNSGWQATEAVLASAKLSQPAIENVDRAFASGLGVADGMVLNDLQLTE